MTGPNGFRREKKKETNRQQWKQEFSPRSGAGVRRRTGLKRQPERARNRCQTANETKLPLGAMPPLFVPFRCSSLNFEIQKFLCVFSPFRPLSLVAAKMNASSSPLEAFVGCWLSGVCVCVCLWSVKLENFIFRIKHVLFCAPKNTENFDSLFSSASNPPRFTSTMNNNIPFSSPHSPPVQHRWVDGLIVWQLAAIVYQLFANAFETRRALGAAATHSNGMETNYRKIQLEIATLAKVYRRRELRNCQQTTPLNNIYTINHNNNNDRLPSSSPHHRKTIRETVDVSKTIENIWFH